MNYSEKTVVGYMNCLKKIDMLNIEYKNGENIDKIIECIKEIKSKDGKTISNNNVKLYLSAIMWYYKQNKIYNDDMKKISGMICDISKINNDIYDENVLSKKEKEVYIEWEEIVKVYNKLYEIRKNNFTSFKNCVTIALYVLFPPRRLMDYSLMVVKDNSDELKEDENYYIMNSSIFIFNIFKTKKTCEKIFEVSDELVKILNEYIEMYKLVGKKLLNIGEKELSEKIKRIMKKETGKSASVNTMRHSYITYMENNGLIKTTKLKKELASKMGHSHYTQQDIYVKNL